MSAQPYHQIIVYRRDTDGMVHAYRQSWYWAYRPLAGWQYRYTEREVPMVQLWGGHTAWIADQLNPPQQNRRAA